MPPPKDPNKYSAYIKMLRDRQLGKKLSDETKLKIGDGVRGEKNGNYGREFSEEHKRKISESTIKRMLDPEERKRLSLSAKNKPHIKDQTRKKMTANMKRRWSDPYYRKEQIEMRIGTKNSFYGKKHTEEARKKISINNTDPSEETRRLMSHRASLRIGEKSSNWKGGIAPLHLLIRGCAKYVKWRDAVFKRDDFRDWFSGVKGNGNLHAHHFVSFASIMRKNNIKTVEQALKCGALWDINNGITMIDSNHIAHHTMWGWDKSEVIL